LAASKKATVWRLAFAFDGEDVTDLDLIDYH